MLSALLLVALSSPLPFQVEVGPATPIAPPRRASRHPFLTFVTGEVLGADVVLEVRFDPARADSARTSVVLVEPRGEIDGIDFVPGAPEAVAALPTGKIVHYDLAAGTVLPDFIPFTDAIAVPPPPGTHPSSVWSTPTHIDYVENQFGFGATSAHRIVRKPFGGGPEEVVYDGAPHGLENFEGLEGVAGRLYFFAEDPLLPTARALVSIGVGPGGLWSGMPPVVHIGGLFESPFSSDGSDELDFDPVSGLLFGTNIVNGEVIAWDPAHGMEVSSPGALHFVDAGQIGASVGALSALGGVIDGVRSVGNGWLVFTGKAGVMVSLSIPGVLLDGADDGDARVLLALPGASFDDLTPVVPVE